MNWISETRALLYRGKILQAVELPGFTLSVGNLSMGGTGKSPIVSYLAHYFLDRSIPTALLSRGYGRKNREPVALAPNSPLPEASLVGDEPWMIRESNPQLALAIHSRRGDLALAHWQELGSPKIALLDDAFQHWRIARDLDLVTIDATEPPHQFVMPFGRLRESMRALQRADLVILTRVNEVDHKHLDALKKRILAVLAKKRVKAPWKRTRFSFGRPILLECQYEFEAFRDAYTKKAVPKEELEVAFILSGIAKPKSFQRLLLAQGIKPKESLFLRDHEAWSPSLEKEVQKAIARWPKLRLIITQKDWARWQEPLRRLKLPTAFAEVSMRFSPESKEKLLPILEKISSCTISA